jgi:hypothetical protein
VKHQTRLSRRAFLCARFWAEMCSSERFSFVAEHSGFKEMRLAFPSNFSMVYAFQFWELAIFAADNDINASH